MEFSEEEIALLRLSEPCSCGSDDFRSVVSSIQKGNSTEAFQHPWFAAYKSTTLGNLSTSTVPPEDSSRTLQYLTTGIAFLEYFVQQNFVGPIDDSFPFPFFAEETSGLLDLDGESAYHLVRAPGALLAAKSILSSATLPSSVFWKRRYAFVHSQIISERVESLLEVFLEENKVLRDTPDINKSLGQDLWTQLRLESCTALNGYWKLSDVREFLDEVAKDLGLELELGGALGTRTQYQKNSLPQLTLQIERKDTGNAGDSLKPNHTESDGKLLASANLPKDVKLQDDVLLERISFDKLPESESLTGLEQVFVLGYAMLQKRFNAPEEILNEELMTYFNRLLSEPRLWPLHFCALYERSKIEVKHSRRAERSIMQFQSLKDHIQCNEPSLASRTQFFYALQLPATWTLTRDVAYGYLSLGLVKSAVDHFVQLELWEEVVTCHVSLKQFNRAIELVEKLLKEEKNPLLYCILGDLTQDEENFRIALELSNGRNARAERSWGALHFSKKEYDAALPHYRRSVEMNPLNLTALQRLAFCCMTLGHYEECISAYKRVVNIDSDIFEAWNNMAKAYISLDQKDKAWKLFQESLKCNYENWRIWENYILVSMDVGAFNEVVKSWHRLIDIRGKHVDSKIAALLVQVVVEDLKDSEGNAAAAYLKPKLFELFGRATTGVTNDADMWRSYGDLYASSLPDASVEHVQKMVQTYQKGLRSIMQVKVWERDGPLVDKILGICDKVLGNLARCSVNADELASIRASLGMTLKNIFLLIGRALEYHENANDVQERIRKLEAEINT